MAGRADARNSCAIFLLSLTPGPARFCLVHLQVSDKLSTNIAANLKRLRLARQVSQQKLSELSGVPRPTLAHLESGAANPTLSVVLKVSEALKVRLEELLQQPEPAIAHYRGTEIPARSRAGTLRQRLLMDDHPALAFERIQLSGGARWNVKASGPGYRHHLFCESGQVKISAAGENRTVLAGEAAALVSQTAYCVASSSKQGAVLFRVVVPVLHGG